MTPLSMALRDAWARVQRTIEALSDGDGEFAQQLLDDLAHDLWKQIEAIERQGGSP